MRVAELVANSSLGMETETVGTETVGVQLVDLSSSELNHEKI